MSYESPQALMP